jgi:hypothetical protein
VHEVGPSLPDGHAPPDGLDLAANRPGQAARAKAVEVQRSAPITSFLGRALGLHTEEKGWRAGAEGEGEVARRLRKLGPGWHVVHAVGVGPKNSDIDHVVIGPAGVFSLNTKNHRGRKVWVADRVLLVGGQKTDYFRTSRFEATRASTLLSRACGFDVTVEPVIVLIAASVKFRGRGGDVHVVGRKSVAAWLTSRPRVLSAETVEVIFDQARRAQTWRPGGPTPKG